MCKCPKVNWLCLLSLILISVGIVLMVLHREELLGTLVKYLAIPITIIACVYLVTGPFFNYMKDRDFEAEHGKTKVALKKRIEETIVEIHDISNEPVTLFDDNAVNPENYKLLVYCLGMSLVLTYYSSPGKAILSMLNDCILYLQTHDFNKEHIEDLQKNKYKVLQILEVESEKGK